MSGVEMSAIGRSVYLTSGIRRSIFGLLLLLASAQPKVFKACQVAYELSKITVVIAGVSSGLNCSPADVARTVCIASLHNYNTSYTFKMDNNDTALGLFGIPTEYTKNCTDLRKSDNFQDHFDCLTKCQFQRYFRKNIQKQFVSEAICKEAELSLRDYFRIFDMWNMSDTSKNEPNEFYKRKVTCQNLDVDYLYIAKEELRKIYRPGVLYGGVSAKKLSDDDLAFESCKEPSYCMNSCRKSAEGSEPDPAGNRKHKGRMERKVERFGRIVDQAIIVFWIIAVCAALVAGYIFIRNPRHRGGLRHNDWSRPILTAHFSE